MDEVFQGELAALLGPWVKPAGIPEPAWQQLTAWVDRITGAPPEPMSDDDKAQARAIFEGKHPDRRACEHCGGIHARSCPRVKSERFVYSHSAPTDISRVVESEIRYWPPGTWETDDVTFPEDVYE